MQQQTAFDFSTIMFPIQGPQHARYVGDTNALPARLYALMEAVTPLRPHTADGFDVKWSDRVDNNDMASSPLALSVLQFLIGLTASKSVLEIGTFVGVSALHMAHALPPSAPLVTIEKYDHFAEIARRNFAANGMAEQIELLEGDAFDILPRLVTEGRRFDFIFLDGDKGHYWDYFAPIDRLLSIGGLLVADNMFFQCDVCNDEPVTEKGAGVLRFLKNVANESNYRRVLLPYYDGTMLLHKLA